MIEETSTEAVTNEDVQQTTESIDIVTLDPAVEELIEEIYSIMPSNESSMKMPG